MGATAQILVPAANQVTVHAIGGATFAGMQDGYAAYSAGSGTYTFHSTTR